MLVSMPEFYMENSLFTERTFTGAARCRPKQTCWVKGIRGREDSTMKYLAVITARDRLMVGCNFFPSLSLFPFSQDLLLNLSLTFFLMNIGDLFNSW